jgi:hypothetical protein
MSPKTFRKRTGKKLGKRQNGAGNIVKKPDTNYYKRFYEYFFPASAAPVAPVASAPASAPAPAPAPAPAQSKIGGSKKRRQKKVRKTSKR